MVRLKKKHQHVSSQLRLVQEPRLTALRVCAESWYSDVRNVLLGPETTLEIGSQQIGLQVVTVETNSFVLSKQFLRTTLMSS